MHKACKKQESRHDITYYATDSRLTEPSDGVKYDLQKAIEKAQELNRPLTKEEYESFQLDSEECSE